MSKDAKNVPALRFKGYSDAWEKRKLGEVTTIFAGGDIDKERLNNTGKYPVISNALTRDGIVGYYEDYKVHAPAVTVTGRGDVGHARSRHTSYTPIVRLLTVQSKSFDSDFLASVINNTNILVESTGVPQLTSPQLGSYHVSFPLLTEQRKIGQFITVLEDLIAATQHKIDALEQAKKALLQRLFDQSWRFKGYSDPWEKRKLGDILNYEQPTPYIVRSENYQNSFPTPVLTAGKSLLLGYTNETNGIKSASKSSPVIIFDDFTTSSHLIDFPFKIKSSAMKILSPSNNDSDIYFSFGLLSSINYVSKNHERHWISQFSNFRVQVPSVHEQACVSRVLLNVTDLIAATQSRLSSLELLKKSLLQGLFI